MPGFPRIIPNARQKEIDEGGFQRDPEISEELKVYVQMQNLLRLVGCKVINFHLYDEHGNFKKLEEDELSVMGPNKDNLIYEKNGDIYKDDIK